MGSCSCEDCMDSVGSIIVGLSASVAAAVFSSSSAALFSGDFSFFGCVANIAQLDFPYC